MGVKAPILLASPISIPLPSIIDELFPICATISHQSPVVGNSVVESGTPIYMVLGSSIDIKDNAPIATATATVTASANVFMAGSEVRH
jgi:hypothetical protein